MTLVVATHNEASSLDSLGRSLSSLDYPEEKLWTVLVDDHSSDATAARIAEWADGHPRTTALPLAEQVGKHQAQRKGMAAASGEIVVCCDADVRPDPDCLRLLTGAFADQAVGSAAAYLTPGNAAAGPVAHYAAVEAWVTQLVSYAGKDRLDLNAPTPGGCCAYRRAALEQIGWLGAEPGGDVRVSVALTRAGWRTRFVQEAIAQNTVVDNWEDYWHQHIRWARNLFAAAGTRRTLGRAPLRRRAEAWMLSAGYADRLVLLAALQLILAGRLRTRFAGLYLAVITAEVWAALAKARVGRDGVRFFFSTVALFALDVVASVTATLAHLLGRPRGWRQGRWSAPADP